MDYPLESNERILVMFDAVCAGLSNCLALVHGDIKQMTEHRNKLALLDQEEMEAKCVSAKESFAQDEVPRRHSTYDELKRVKKKKNVSKDDDPHHLASLKLLDKRLADSFNQAFNLNDQQKSTIAAKHYSSLSRPSIFQVLLGKTSKKLSSQANLKEPKGEPEKVDNKLVIDDINRQTRLAMQYSKQLEAHLFKVEDLRSKYEMHLKMGLVVKNVARAHLNIERIENTFESYMGSFLLVIEDIQGFARVCPGDVFEINIKYGDSQKFKTKISVLKDNRQKCDNRQNVFKARIADVLAIKAYECKGLGKKIQLGHKLCETRDLFTAQSQLMTISLNQTGSIKLNLIVTWNPLHLTPNSTSNSMGSDISHISLPPTPISSSTLSSSSSMPSLNGATTTINIKSQKLQHRPQIHNHRTSRFNESFCSDSQHQQHSQMYQTIDPTYGYYIPPPDYLSTDVKYQDG